MLHTSISLNTAFFSLYIISVLLCLGYACRFHTLHSPSPWQEIHFNKWVRVAIVVPRGKVSGLQDMNDQVAKLLVIVDLKLQKQRSTLNYIWLKFISDIKLYKKQKVNSWNFTAVFSFTVKLKVKTFNQNSHNFLFTVHRPVSLQRWGGTESLFPPQTVRGESNTLR